MQHKSSKFSPINKFQAKNKVDLLAQLLFKLVVHINSVFRYTLLHIRLYSL